METKFESKRAKEQNKSKTSKEKTQTGFKYVQYCKQQKHNEGAAEIYTQLFTRP